MGVSNESHGLLQLDKGSKDLEAAGSEAMTQHRCRVQRLKGVLAALMYVASIITGVTNIQLLQRRIPDLELQAFRCAGVVIACLVWMLVKQELPTLPLPNVTPMLLYALLVTLGVTLYFIGFALIPLAEAQCTDSTSRLLSGLCIFRLCGQESFSLKKTFCVLLCFVGVILVVQPWHRTSDKIPTWSNHSKNCTMQMEDMCSFNKKTNTISNLKNCTQNLLPGTNEMTNPCNIFQNKTVAQNLSHQLEIVCHEWLSCWSDSVRHNSFMKSNKKKNKRKIKLLLVKVPQKFVVMIGILIVGLSGVINTLFVAVFQRFRGVRENIVRSLFWSNLFGLTSSFVLTFLLESPVWPQSIFDTVAVCLHLLGSIGVWIFLSLSLQNISGMTFNIIASTAVVFFLIPQYTILASILPGHKNWMEVAGVCIVFSGTILASVQEMFAASDHPSDLQN